MLTLMASPVFASRDSIAFFYKPEKVGILINERGTSGRIHDFMDHLGASEDLYLLSKDETIMLGCKRIENAATCTFRFLPGADVLTENKELHVKTSLSNFNLEEIAYFEMKFLSSMKDNIHLEIKDGFLNIDASKK